MRRPSKALRSNAIRDSSTFMSEKNQPMTFHNTIGKSLPRIDARGKVTGETLYSGDLSMPDMLYMKILFTDRPHARITGIDTSKAETASGIVAVYTAKDVPVNEYGLQWQDQPVLCGPLTPASP